MSGTWYRAGVPRYIAHALHTGHTRQISSRFSASSPTQPGFEILYLAENHLVAMFEAQALYGSPTTPGGVLSNPAVSLVTLAVTVSLRQVADLTEVNEAAIVETNAQELTGYWRGYQQRGPTTPAPLPIGKAPTQELGEALYQLYPHNCRTIESSLFFRRGWLEELISLHTVTLIRQVLDRKFPFHKHRFLANRVGNLKSDLLRPAIKGSGVFRPNRATESTIELD